MRVLDVSFQQPEMNLATDEALLNDAEAHRGPQSLRFWESPTPFVVLGLTQKINDVVNVEACRADSVPIMRRCSAGGCVVQGPGCLNFSLILAYAQNPDLRTIRGSYNFILGAIAEGISQHGQEVAIRGVSDLTVEERKVSGNAQRRRKKFLLHHGTLLYDFDIDLAQRYLNEPVDRPEYRGTRRHEDFVANLPLDRETLCITVRECFESADCEVDLRSGVQNAARDLARDKYSDTSWIHRS